MINGKQIVLVLPAYNAEDTLKLTYEEIPFEVVDQVILVDDGSSDETVEIARSMGIKHIITHNHNQGYGANQKSCYQKALDLGGDIIIMLHPDYQYPPSLIPAMAGLIAYNVFPVVYASRILGKEALKGRMPYYKYIANRLLTLLQNYFMNQKLSEYHTGYRAFSRKVLESLDFSANSNDFVFDNQITAQIFYSGYSIGEVTCPTQYFDKASSINFRRSVVYGLGVLRTTFQYLLQRKGLARFPIFEKIKGRSTEQKDQ